MINVPQKFSKEVAIILPKALNDKFEKEVENIVDVGVETYENLLFGVVASRNSMADPENFYDSYIDELEKYKFIDEEDTNPTLHIPSKENFTYDGVLSILEFIVEGVAGIYLELPEMDLKEILNSKNIDDKVKRKIRALPGITDTEVPINMRFRLLHTRGTLSSTVQSILDKKLTTFPFSNSSPVDLFEPMQDYVEKNIDDWINGSINDSLKIVKQRYN